MIIKFHGSTVPYCGAVGPIAYRDGEAWSVNAIMNGDEIRVMDWRFELRYLPNGCKECERHMNDAKELK